MGQEIWVVSEQDLNGVTDLTIELLGIAKTAARNRKARVAAVLLSKENNGLVEVLASRGADRIYFANHQAFEQYNTEACADTVSSLIKEYKPALILCGMTINGRDLSARLAARLNLPLIPACVSLKSTGNGFEVSSLVYNGLAQSTRLVGEEETLMLVFTPQTRGVEACDYANVPDLIAIEPVLSNRTVDLRIKTCLSDLREIGVSEASVVISGGYGMGNEGSFQLLWKLAELLGGTVGGSRIAVDKGWLPVERMVGITGKIITPGLYFAFGLSGALQHMMGINGSKIIIAVNSDAGAQIMQVADLAVVGNACEVLSALIEKIEFYLSGPGTELIDGDAGEAV